MLNAADGVNRCLRVISLFLSLLLIARRRVRPPNEKSHRPEPEGELWLRIQGPNFPADSKQNGWAPVRCTGWFENLTPWPRPTPARKSVGSSQEAAEAAEKSSSIPLRCLCVLLLNRSSCFSNAKVSDGSQPPMTLNLSLSESAGSRSLPGRGRACARRPPRTRT
jgi:hypothetical protein